MTPSKNAVSDTIASLVTEALALDAVSPSARGAFHRAMPALVKQMNRAMSDDPRIDELIGGNPLTVMTADHSRHADFMDAVLRIRQYELLARVVPLVYGTHIGRGFLPAYFPVALKRWKAAVSFHIDNDAADEIIAVYDWMIDCHDRFLLASAIPMRLAERIPTNWQETAEAFYDAVVGNRVNEAIALAHQSVAGPDDLNAFCRCVIQPSLYWLGNQWAAGALSVAEEHRGTAIAARIMASFYPMIFNTPKTRGTAIVSASANEFHDIGGRMVADALTLSGWETFFLGANTPTDSLLTLLEDSDADLLALSVVMPFNLGRLIDLIDGIRLRQSMRCVKVMVGGWAFNMIPDLWAAVSADGTAENGPAAARLAARWWEMRQRGQGALMPGVEKYNQQHV